MDPEIRFPLKARRGSGASKSFSKRKSFAVSWRVFAASGAILALGVGAIFRPNGEKTPVPPKRADVASSDGAANAFRDLERAEDAGRGVAETFAPDAEPEIARSETESEPDVVESSANSANFAAESVDPVDDPDELAARLQAELRARGVDGAVVERWGGRFWRVSGKTPPDANGCVAFCEAFGVDPTEAARGAINDWRKKIAAANAASEKDVDRRRRADFP